MCGIIGYVGNKNASDVLIEGLKALEYRGYDSAGITVNINGSFKTIKSVGKIAELEKKIKNLEENHEGIGHTRWATHGSVTKTNSHPHTLGCVTLVHNGIIENFRELKKELKNVNFVSETDSEVAAALINHYYKNDPIKAINRASKKFEGSFALLIMFDNDNALYAIRKGSPLIVGIGNNENFVASDISAILAYTKKYFDMKEYDIYKVTKNEITIYDKEMRIVHRDILTAKWDISAALKNGYDHFMLKEINEQPELTNKVKEKYLINNKKIDVIDINKYKRIDVVACGSAYNAGLIGKALFDKYNFHNNNYMIVDVASEYRYKSHYFDKDVLVIVISQSGETADTLAALRLANENNVDTLAIVNVVSSSIAKEAKYIMPMLAGPEIAVATTKGYYTQVYNIMLLILNTLLKNKIFSLNEYANENVKVQKYIKKLINTDFINVANFVAKKEHIYFIGRGIDYATCLEASLKLKEISYIHSEAYQAGELKHGPIALIEKDTIVFALITDTSIKDKTISNAIEAQSRGAKIVLVTSENVQADLFNYVIKLPKTISILQPLVNIIPFQIIAYYVAKIKKCDIDKPKNLAKSVTVE